MVLGYEWFVWYVVSGGLTKLRAYGLQFWFQVLPVADDGARGDRMTHTIN